MKRPTRCGRCSASGGASTAGRWLRVRRGLHGVMPCEPRCPRSIATASVQILAAMNGGDNRRVTLAEPIQVVIFYTTTVVLPEEGSVHFAQDLYGHDLRLDNAL